MSCHHSTLDIQQEYYQTKVLSQPLMVTLKRMRSCLPMVGEMVSQAKDVQRMVLRTGNSLSRSSDPETSLLST